MPFPEKKFKQFLHEGTVFSFLPANGSMNYFADGKTVNLPVVI
jgi:hypothetical protein